ncbi:MAG: OmpA family protein [Rhodospirillaceae bacterium]
MAEKCKCPAGAPLWLVTFADLMSLLLTFFILMLSFAELDIVKWRQLAGAMSEAFGVAEEDRLAGMVELEGVQGRKSLSDLDPTRQSSLQPEQLRPVVEAETREEDNTATAGGQMPTLSEDDLEEQQEILKQARVEELYTRISKELQEEISGSGIQLERQGDEVIIRFPSDISFPSGSGTPTEQFGQIIDRIIPALKTMDGDIYISGHTDNIPVSGSGLFRSNWDLSASRATSVVHRILEHGFQTDRITIQGYGESRPIASNDSAEGRAKNRRVELSVVARDPTLDALGNVVPTGDLSGN